VLAGGTGTGKTTLSQVITDRAVIHTDDWAPASKRRPAGKHWRPGMTWENTPAVIVAATPPSPVIIEGARGVGLMRAGIDVDCFVWLDSPVEQLESSRLASWRGRQTDFNNWIDSGETRGIRVVIIK